MVKTLRWLLPVSCLGVSNLHGAVLQVNDQSQLTCFLIRSFLIFQGGIALLLAVPLLCAAQAIPRPDIKVGDSWTYRRMDYDTNKPRGEYTMRVVLAGPDMIQAVNAGSGQEGEYNRTYTVDWNAVKLPTQSFNPHSGWFKFPLQVGDVYSAAFDSIVKIQRHGSTVQLDGRNDRTVKVVGWEEVIVPAGRFRALKVVSEGLLNRTDTAQPIVRQARNVIWYVPEIKRWAKITFEDQPLGRGWAGMHMGEELVAYELK
jgi:hypothetical protein